MNFFMEIRFIKLEGLANSNNQNNICYNFIMQKIEIGKIYRHYKGNLYKIIALAKHSETLEDMVVYSSLDNSKIWTRPQKMWNEIVDDKGTLRFKLIEE